MTRLRTSIPTVVLCWLVVGCTARWSHPETEPEELQILRPKLARLSEGMAENQVFTVLGLDASTMTRGGCLHEATYTRFWDRDYMLSVKFAVTETNTLALRGVRLVTFKRREEIWPK